MSDLAKKTEKASVACADMTPYIASVQTHSTKLAAELGHSPRCYVLTFGCQQNEADSEKLMGMAMEMGYVAADDPRDADLILVNTCAIREHAEKRALSIIGQFKHLKEQKSHLVIGICGCMVAQEHRRVQLQKSYPYVSFVLCTSVLYRLPQYLAEVFDRNKRIFKGDEEMTVAEGLPICRTGKYRAYVSIMYGCNNFCSYCIVPYVRGRERSREPQDVINEVKELVAAGYRDITLLGQNVNSYGKGCLEGYDFADLLAELDRIPGDYTLHFMTSHPKDATKKLVDVMAAGTHIAHSFHLPLQSGSDEILRRMNRHYDKAQYLEILDYMRKKMPDIAVTSDIIVGFPGESEADFEDTLAMLKRARFDMIYSFIYSPRKGTPAAEMPTQISREVQNARFDRLLALQNEISCEKNTPLVGTVQRVLCDGVSKKDTRVYNGRTEQNKLVFFEEPITEGEWVKVRIDRVESFALYGTVVK